MPAVNRLPDVTSVSNLVATAAAASPTSVHPRPPDTASVRLDTLDASVRWTSMIVSRSRASTVSIDHTCGSRLHFCDVNIKRVRIWQPRYKVYHIFFPICYLFVTLHASCGAVYCNRSCLFVCLCVWVGLLS